MTTIAPPRWTVEAWTMPGSSPFQRRVLDVPGVLSFDVPASGVGRIRLDIPAVWDRLDDVLDPLNDVGSLLRVIETDRSGDPQIRAEYVVRRTASPFSESGKIVKLTAPSIEDELEATIVYPYDWPPPSRTVDHIYGGEASVASFSNGGLEEGDYNGDAESGSTEPWTPTAVVPQEDGVLFTTPLSFTVQTADVAAGTYAFVCVPNGPRSGFKLDIPVVGGETYDFAAVLKEATAAGLRYTMFIDLGDDSTTDAGQVWSGYGVSELDGAVDGASDGTFQTLDQQVTFGAEVESTTVYFLFDEPGAGLEFIVDSITITGPGIGLDPWEQTDPANTDVFEIDTVVKRSGDQSLKWKAGAGAVLGGVGVRQKVTGLVIGKTYTWGQYHQHDGGGNVPIRVVAYRVSAGSFLSSDLTQIPTGTTDWTYASTTFVADATEAWLDFRHDAAGASPNMSMDDGNLAEGLAPATIGVMGIALLDDAQTDHAAEAGDFVRETLLWLKPDFTALLDSSGNAWRAEESLRISRGKTYAKVIFGDFATLGYEARIRPNPDYPTIDSESHLLQIFNPSDPVTKIGGASVDLTGSVGFSAGSVVAGPTVKTPKSRTVALSEGAAQEFAIVKDAPGVAAWGAREIYVGSTATAFEGSSIAQVAANTLAERSAAIQASRITITDDDNFSPFIDFDPGDWVRGELPPDLPRGDHRIVGITVRIAENAAMFDLDLGAKVFVGSAGQSEAIRRLLSKFDSIPEPASEAATVGASTPFTGPIEPTILVAASDARPEIRAVADLKCDGVNDQAEIQSALDALPTGGGRVFLSEGTFVLTAPAALGAWAGIVDMPANTSLIGVGAATILEVESSTSTMHVGVYMTGAHCEIAHMTIEINGSTANNLYCVYMGGQDGSLHHCWFAGMSGSANTDLWYVAVDNNGVCSECHFLDIASGGT